MRVAPSLGRIPEELSEGPYAQALEVARRANFTEEEWQEYERAKMAEQDFRGGLSLAEKRGLEQGLKQGEQRGLKRGLSQGRKEGRKEGREEGREEGRKEGELRGQVTTLAEAGLTVLTARGLSISDSVRAQILATTDPALLASWLARASTAASAEDCLTQPSV